MKIGQFVGGSGISLVLAALLAASALAQPKQVPRMSVQSLDQASYVALARDWRQYMDTHGETADGLVNLGRAQLYSGAREAAELSGKRAVALEPDNPRALNFYGGIISVSMGDNAEAIKLLKRCIEIAPDYGDAYPTLTASYLRVGELTKARDVSKTIFDRRIVPRPLQDLAYNMLIGLPHGAVLVTNGDNDTFPPLALQAGMDLRTDVVVVNRHLLNAPQYADSLFREHAILGPAGSERSNEVGNASRSIMERWIADRKVPVYFATSVSMNDVGFTPKTVVEGVVLRATGTGLTPEAAARVVLERYRLDSATDWDYPWDLEPEVTQAMQNYVSSFVQLSQLGGVPKDLKCRLLAKAAEIARVHEFSVAGYVESLLKKCEKE